VKSNISIYRIKGGGFMVVSGESCICKNEAELKYIINAINPKLKISQVDKLVETELKNNSISINMKRKHNEEN